MLPFGVSMPATVQQRSEFQEGLINYPVLKYQWCTVKQISNLETGFHIRSLDPVSSEQQQHYRCDSRKSSGFHVSKCIYLHLPFVFSTASFPWKSFTLWHNDVTFCHKFTLYVANVLLFCFQNITTLCYSSLDYNNNNNNNNNKFRSPQLLLLTYLLNGAQSLRS